jgi:hypothetical protein
MRVSLFRGVLLAAATALAGCGGADSSPLPVAPVSDIAVTTATSSISGTSLAEMIAGTTDCPPERGVGLRAAAEGAAVSVVFPRWPEEGAVYDLSVPGTSDFVVVSATSGLRHFCAPEEGGSGMVLVNHFEQVGDRYLASVEVSGVVAGAATLDAHLYH